MSEKSLTAKQHFVPQFYLRNFADQDKKLHIFNAKERRVARPRAASGVCYEQFFYANETGTPDEISQEIEKYFSSQVEDPLSKELPKIIKKIESGAQITDDDKYTLAIFMNTMWLRNPAMRNMFNDMEEKLIRRMTAMRYSHPSIDKKLEEIARENNLSVTKEERDELKRIVLNEEYAIKFPNKSHLEFMLDPEHMRGFSNLFFGQHWVIHISRCDRKFVTSDNPVTVVIPKKTGFWGASFLERTHLFPLTPTITIEAVYPHKDTGKKVKRKTHFKGDEGAVDDINLKMASHSNEFIYSSRPEEIEWFKKYVETSNRT